MLRQPGTSRRLRSFVKEAGSLVERFSELARDPIMFRESNGAELDEMRTFCLALSRAHRPQKRRHSVVSPSIGFGDRSCQFLSSR